MSYEIVVREQRSQDLDSGPLSVEEVHEALREKATFQSLRRRARQQIEELERLSRRVSSPEDELEDWHRATVHFAYEVLRGEIQLPRLSAASFGHLEDVWLDEVKLVWAYFHWKSRAEPLWEDTHDYFTAERLLRESLLGRKEKRLAPRAFEEVKAYVEREYLVNGYVVSPPEGKGETLIAAKARRLSMSRPPASSEEERRRAEHADWLKAEAYVRDFYEGIVGVGLDAPGEPASRRVGRAFADNENIANTFEAAIGGYYVSG